MNDIDKYLEYVSSVRRYSPRTVEIYRAALERFMEYSGGEDVPSALSPSSVRNYEVHLLDECGESPRTVNLHLSVLSGFSRYMLREGRILTNPVRLVKRPRTPKRLPQVFRKDDLERYFEDTAADASADTLDLVAGGDKLSMELWERRRDRLIIRTLYDTGLRRSELIGLKRMSLDFSRRSLRVKGKGGKMREIPLTSSLCEEISLYLKATFRTGLVIEDGDPLFVTAKGGPLYPVAVDRIVKSQTGGAGVTGKRSPHVLRHTIATGLLDEGADLNSIKEFLGLSSLAATQVYTHNSPEKLKAVYAKAHPRAEKE